MKFCAKCGKAIVDEVVICPGCGTPINKGNEQPGNKSVPAFVLGLMEQSSACLVVFVYLLAIALKALKEHLCFSWLVEV